MDKQPTLEQEQIKKLKDERYRLELKNSRLESVLEDIIEFLRNSVLAIKYVSLISTAFYFWFIYGSRPLSFAVAATFIFLCICDYIHKYLVEQKQKIKEK